MPPHGEVVTVVEILSLANKLPGEGRRLYELKRGTILASPVSLVEIDLLRAAGPMAVLGTERTADYRLLISRGDRRPRAGLHLFSVRDPIPRFRLPLPRRDDQEPEVDLGEILHALHERASYDLVVDYSGEPVPPLAEKDRAWADRVLREAGGRR